MHKHFCKLCNTPAPQGAVTNPTIVFLKEGDYSKSLTLHFDCVDKEIVGQWNSISIPQVFEGQPIKSIILAQFKFPGMIVPHSDFTVLEEAWDQRGQKGVIFEKVAAGILIQNILKTRVQANTEDPQHSMMTENGTQFVPLAISA